MPVNLMRPCPAGDARLFLGKLVRSMQSGYASLGEDGGSRCRYCAAQDRPQRLGGGLQRHTPSAREGVTMTGGGFVGSVTGTDIDKVKSYVAQGEEWLIGRVSRPLRFS